jgi:hypothetical protein
MDNPNNLENQRDAAYFKRNLCRSFLYGSFTIQKSRVIDILGWSTPDSGSLYIKRTVLARKANLSNDSSRTARARPKFLVSVEGASWDVRTQIIVFKYHHYINLL